MPNLTFSQIYAEHRGKSSDKWSSYLVIYDRVFFEYRDKPVRLFEIGVQNGGSLEIFAKYFSQAKVLVGCDINTQCSQLLFEDVRVAVVVGDANSDPVQSEILQHATVFDVIIDDGSHCSGDIIKSFVRYFPVLAEGGVFLVEDLHCSYWAEFDGGLFDPFSSMAFFKLLADVINYEHWGVSRSRSDILRGFCLKYGVSLDDSCLQSISSVEFVNSICIIKKKSPISNTLGTRLIAGKDSGIDFEAVAQQSKGSQAPSQTENTWATRSNPLGEDVLRLEHKLKMAETDLIRMNETVFSLEVSKKEILSSLSWRVTRPFRFLSELVKKSFRIK